MHTMSDKSLDMLLFASLQELSFPGHIFAMTQLPLIEAFNSLQEHRRQHVAALIADAVLHERISLEEFKTRYSLRVEANLERFAPEIRQERRETLELQTAHFFALVDRLIAIARE